MKFIIRAYVKLTGYDKDVDGPCEDFNVCMWKVFDTPVHVAGVDTIWIRTPWDDLTLHTEQKSVDWDDSRPLVYAVDMDLKIQLENEQMIDEQAFISGMSSLGWCFDRWDESWKRNWDEVLSCDKTNEKHGDDRLLVFIEDCNLPVRARNCLIKRGVHTIGDLVKHSPTSIAYLRNCGAKTAKVIREMLQERGLDYRGH